MPQLYTCNVPIFCVFCGIDMLLCVRKSLFPSQTIGGWLISKEGVLSNTHGTEIEVGNRERKSFLDFAHVKHRWLLSDTRKRNPKHNSPPLTLIQCVAENLG